MPWLLGEKNITVAGVLGWTPWQRLWDRELQTEGWLGRVLRRWTCKRKNSQDQGGNEWPSIGGPCSLGWSYREWGRWDDVWELSQVEERGQAFVSLLIAGHALQLRASRNERDASARGNATLGLRKGCGWGILAQPFVHTDTEKASKYLGKL